MQIATKNMLGFEPKIPIDATSTGITESLIQPTLGPLANLRDKPARMAWAVRFEAESSVSTPAKARIRIKAAGNTLAESAEFEMQNSEGGTGGELDVELSGIEGQTKLKAEIEITQAGDSNLSATADVQLYVTQPLVITEGI